MYTMNTKRLPYVILSWVIYVIFMRANLGNAHNDYNHLPQMKNRNNFFFLILII